MTRDCHQCKTRRHIDDNFLVCWKCGAREKLTDKEKPAYGPGECGSISAQKQRSYRYKKKKLSSTACVPSVKKKQKPDTKKQ